MAKSNPKPADTEQETNGSEEQTSAAPQNATQAAEIDPWKIKKSITIPRLAGSKEQPDIIASVNGRIFQIQRGKTVEVPEPIYEVLNRSFAAEMQAEIDYYDKANNGGV